MKTGKFFTLAACMLCGMLAFTSCSDDDDDNTKKPEVNDGKAKMMLAVDMAPTASMGYIIPVKDENVTEVNFTNAHEQKSTPYICTYKDWVFAIGGTMDANVTKYIRNNDGTLTQAGKVQIDRVVPMCANMIVMNETKAYATAPVENKIVIFNPTTMERTGEIDLVDTKWGVNGSNTPNPVGLFIRDNILYVGLCQFDNMPVCKTGAYVLLIDTKTDKPIKMISDMRLSSATVMGVCGMFVDEKNDLYVPCWGSYGYVPGHHSGLLRIKNGETEFDKSYCFNFTDREYPDVKGNKIQYVLSSHYAGNGEFYFFGYCPAYASATGADYINDKTNISFKADLYNCTAKVIDLPRTNGYSCAISHKNDLVYFGLVTESAGTGLFTYNRKTGECSKTPVMKVQGSITDIRFCD